MSLRTAIEHLRIAHALQHLRRIAEAFTAGRISHSKVRAITHRQPVIEMNTRAQLRINHTTLTPDWDGERLDPEPILDALLPRRISTAAA